ncbi:MAG: alkaline phosphatase family protein [Tepidiformaceae bacterium]
MAGADGAGRRVMVVVLDSMEISWLDAHLASGAWPNLAAFAESSQRIGTTSQGEVLHGSIWPSWATGLQPGKHGIYFWSQWQAEKMGYFRNTDPLLDFDPFWSELQNDGRTATILDVSYVRAVRAPGFRTASSWGTHDEMEPVSYPDDFLHSLDKTYGKHPLSFDVVEPVTKRQKLEMVRDLRRGVHKRAKVLRDLAARRDWDFLAVSFGETHKAMHYLASDEELRPGTTNQDAIAAILNPLDRAWPSILEAAGEDCDVILMSLHGITEQVKFDGFGSQILDIFSGRTPYDRFENEDLIRKIRNLMPTTLRHAVWRRIPAKMRASRHGALETGTPDLAAQKVFRVPHDGHPAVRVNMAGRERDGIVPPGEDRALLDALEALARQFTTADGKVAFPGTWRSTSEPGPLAHRLPDALLLANLEIARTSELFGPDGVHLKSVQPEARNGVHTGKGFALMRIGGGRKVTRATADGVDFAPTILDLMDAKTQRSFDGNSVVS